MKRALPLVLAGAAVGYLLGYASPHVTLAAQGGQAAAAPAAQAGGPPETRTVQGKGMYYSADDIKKWFPPADKSGNFVSDPKPARTNHLAWDPQYRFTVMRRQYIDPAVKTDSGEVLHYAGSEMHENKTQVYIMLGGNGAVALGGKPTHERPGPIVDGQHGGGNLVGATDYKVKAGDVVVIPPNTWHQALPEPGQTLTYSMCHIEDRNTMP